MDRFRGSAPARLDEKGRLKVPSLFRQQIEEAFGPELFVTSLHGKEVLLYPLAIWRAFEEKLAALPAIHSALRYGERTIQSPHSTARGRSEVVWAS